MKTTILAILFTITVNASGFSQKTPGVFNAVTHNDSITLAMCLNAGLKVNTATASGKTLLMEASRNGSHAAARLLLAHGAKVNARDGMGNTALIEASLRGDETMVALLLHAGASAAIINRAGETALTIAESLENTGIARLISGKEGDSRNQYVNLR